ncbi:MAG: SusC/RagA family TonB-linked outer membrane protein [Tannerellaceae bacterium]|nr:SusC/RagA family TonB-linked outer membrane protein [Tannerellaceae bacterium]
MRNYAKPLNWFNTEERGRIQWQAARNDGNDPNRTELYQFEDHQDANGNWVLDKVTWPEFIDPPYNTMRASDTDWAKEVGQTSVTQNYNVTVSTGGPNGRSLFTLDYLDNKGTIKETFNERISARINSDYSLFNGRLTVAENFSITKTKRSRLDAGSILTNTCELQPIVPVRTEDGEGWGGPWGSMGDRENPVRRIEQSKGNDNHILRLFGDAFLDLEVIKGLHLKTVLGMDYSFYWYRDMFLPYKEGFLSDDTPVVTNRDDRYGNWVWTSTLNYDFKLNENHQFNILAGQEMMKYGWERVEAERKNFADLNPDYMYLDLGETNQRASGSATEYALLSYFGKVNYNYLNRYLLSFTLRYDGSSRFGKNNRFATFPAFSTGWRISEEAFFSQTGWLRFISDFKIRYGWGRTGNQDIGNYASLELYEARYSSDWASGGNFFTGTAYDISGADRGTLPSGCRRMQLANPNLRWESATQNNMGVDFAFLDNQLSGSFDYFIKQTKDILVNPPVLAALGEGSARSINGAAMKNTGFEFILSYNKQVGNLFFNITGNIGAYRNKITELPEDVWDAYPGNAGIGDVILGHALNSYYGYVADGLFQSEAEVQAHADQTGAGVERIRFRDINGDGRITTDDRTWIGVQDPDFIYGMNFSVVYKQWDFSMFWNGASGGTVNVQNTKLYTDFYGAAFTGENNGKRTLDTWSPINTGSTIPMLSAFDNNSEKELSSYFMESGSYLKLRSLELGYTLAKTWADKARMQNLRVYARGDNLLKLKKTWGYNGFTGADPETPNTAYPIPFSFSFGVNVTF